MPLRMALQFDYIKRGPGLLDDLHLNKKNPPDLTTNPQRNTCLIERRSKIYHGTNPQYTTSLEMQASIFLLILAIISTSMAIPTVESRREPRPLHANMTDISALREVAPPGTTGLTMCTDRGFYGQCFADYFTWDRCCEFILDPFL